MTSKRLAPVGLLLALAQIASWAGPGDAGFIVVPDATNAVRLRLYTNAAPDAAHGFNTFDLEAYGEVLLHGVRKDKQPTARPSLLVNGKGPVLQATNSMRILEEARGEDWRFVRLDVTTAYAEGLKEYQRDIVYIAPDLMVVRDHLVAREPARLQEYLQVPAATTLDPVWKDLRFESTKAAVRIHSPGRKNEQRIWQRADPMPRAIPGGSVSMELAPPNPKMGSLDLITVLTVSKAGENKELAYKLLESETAVGARIHRDGYPTLVAFRLSAATDKASLSGFAFTGTVAVEVYHPKPPRAKVKAPAAP